MLKKCIIYVVSLQGQGSSCADKGKGEAPCHPWSRPPTDSPVPGNRRWEQEAAEHIFEKTPTLKIRMLKWRPKLGNVTLKQPSNKFESSQAKVHPRDGEGSGLSFSLDNLSFGTESGMDMCLSGTASSR